MTSGNVLKGTGLIALMALVAGITGGCAAKKSASGYRVGDTVDLARIAVTDLDGQPLDWQEYQDKALVLNYFASW